MSEKGLTTIALKKINRSKIYQYIYRSKLTSKLQIVQDLQMGLSTVSQNLNLLENEGLIEKNGYFDSTGGRKANAIQIVSDFRISIGVICWNRLIPWLLLSWKKNSFLWKLMGSLRRQSGLHFFMWRNLSTRFNTKKSMQNM